MSTAPSDDAVLVCLCTCPDLDGARALGRTLVEERLVACAQLLPGIESIYRWDGRVDTATEVLLLLKTTQACFDRLQARLVALHPYDVPELFALPAVAGLPAYLHWVADSTCAADSSPGASPAPD